MVLLAHYARGFLGRFSAVLPVCVDVSWRLAIEAAMSIGHYQTAQSMPIHPMQIWTLPGAAHTHTHICCQTMLSYLFHTAEQIHRIRWLQGLN